MEEFEAIRRVREEPELRTRAHPYYINAPLHGHTSSHVRVLYDLCDRLRSLGYEAYVTPPGPEVALDAEAQLARRVLELTEEIRERHENSGRVPIAVYPETVAGNPLAASVVARYLLSFPGLHTDHVQYSPWDLLFSYCDEFAPPGLTSRRVYLPAADAAHLSSEGTDPAERTEVVVFYGDRFFSEGHEPIPFLSDAIELSSRVPPRTRSERGALFRKARILYSVELSDVCFEAMLCGCPVALLPHPYIAVQPTQLGKTDPSSEMPMFEVHGGNGLCMGTDEDAIRHATESVGLFRQQYLRDLESAHADVRTFIRITQEQADRALRGAETSQGDESDSRLQSLSAQLDRFRGFVEAGDWRAAYASGVELDQMLEASVKGTRDSGNHGDEACGQILKSVGLSFLWGQYLLVLEDDPLASIPLFRLVAQRCEASRADTAYELLLANALAHECLALERLGRSAESALRLLELRQRKWRDQETRDFVSRIVASGEATKFKLPPARRERADRSHRQTGPRWQSMLSMALDTSAEEAKFRGMLRANQHETLLQEIRETAHEAALGEAFFGRALFLPGLDPIVHELGIALARSRDWPARRDRSDLIVHVASELYDTGGHTRVVADAIRALPEFRHRVVITDLFGHFASGLLSLSQLESVLPAGRVETILLRPDSASGKVEQLFDILAAQSPHASLIFTHYQDTIALAAFNELSSPRNILMHHCDHQPSLGPTRADYLHADLTPRCHRECSDAAFNTPVFLGLCAEDRGVRSRRARGSTVLNAVCSGSPGKFWPDQFGVRYVDLVREVMLRAGGTYHHIGVLFEPTATMIQSELARAGIDARRFVNIPSVASLWQTLLELDADFYVGSAPLGGGRATAEALGAGLPILYPQLPDVTPLLDLDISMGAAVHWRRPEDIAAAVDIIRRQAPLLGERSRRAYEAHFSPTRFRRTLLQLIN